MSIDDNESLFPFSPPSPGSSDIVIIFSQNTFCFPPTYRFMSVDCVCMCIIQNDERLSIQYFTHRFSLILPRAIKVKIALAQSMKYSIQFLYARRSHIARVVVVVFGSSIEHEEFINSLCVPNVCAYTGCV
jgi:hypothetical protein